MSTINRHLAEAEMTYNRLVELINDFEKEIREDEIAALVLPEMTAIIQDIGFYNPNLIIFYGERADGSYVQIIQHVSQVSICLTAAKRPDPEKKRRRIGFDLESEAPH